MRGLAGSADEIAYVDAHDNETLFDALALKLPQATSMDDRVRMNTLALATVTLSQSPCFWHAGTELLRSKSLDRNSYDCGDWFNRIDWTATRLGVRLRAAAALGQRVALEVPAAAAEGPGAQAAAAPHPRRPRPRARAAAHPRLLAAVRRTPTVTFEPGAPGVIVMVLSGEIVVIFNATPARHHADRRRDAPRACTRRTPSAPRPTRTAPSRSRRGPSQCSSRELDARSGRRSRSRPLGSIRNPTKRPRAVAALDERRGEQLRLVLERLRGARCPTGRAASRRARTRCRTAAGRPARRDGR